ncbi:MAG TPA: hypothetical protein P5060_03435 [Candidatus Absconditabacterales bacterium]|nr:hypothetical protein [Candidatus Absconditabacterales bacterium]
MFLLIVIIILISSAGILGSIYVGYFSFLQNYADGENYHSTNYAAISSIERGLLSTKYKNPGYIGSGGFIQSESRGPQSDIITGNFGNINNTSNGLYRDTNSRTQTISGDITYDKILGIILMPDISTNPYTGDNTYETSFFDDSEYISGIIYLADGHESLSPNTGKNVNRKLDISTSDEYIIASPEGEGNQINNNKINNHNTIYFFKDTTDLFNSGATTGSGFVSSGTSHTSGTNIGTIISSGYGENLNIYITGNLIDISNNFIGKLKYYFESNTGFADVYYNITGSAIIGNYKKELFIQKPTSNIKNPNRQSFIFPYYE